MPLRAIEIFRQLEAEDIRLLVGMERATKRYEYVPLDGLLEITGFPPKELEYRLDRLHRFGLIRRRSVEYVGHKILPAGYDALAVWGLVKKNVLEAFGNKLAVGKEADVYDALRPDGTKVAVKFNRLGRTSFTRVKRTRAYGLGRGWMEASKSAAKREFNALKRLYPRVAVPEPIALNRHVLVTGLIEGDELANVADISDPEAVLEEIIRNVREAYRIGVIHADLSEHNVIVKPDGDVLIIDWPQWVSTSHVASEGLLARDVGNVLKYFKRKFGIERDLEKTLNFIRS